jgi:hypothetical protein
MEVAADLREGVVDQKEGEEVVERCPLYSI